MIVFKPVLTSLSLSNLILSQFLHNISLANNIHLTLLLNILKYRVIESLFDSVIEINKKLYVIKKDQLFLNIKRESV